MRTGQIRVGILEDQRLFLECLVKLFEDAGMKVVVQGLDLEGFLAQVEQERPEVALVDLPLEGLLSAGVGEGPRMMEMLRNLHAHTRTLVLSACQEPMLVRRCFQAGASGHLCKLDVGCDELLSAIEQVARGEWLVPPEFVSPVRPPREARTAVLERLSAREHEVLGLVAAGADNFQISAHLGISERTVKAHVSSLYRKLGVQNRVEMALLARQSGVASHVANP